MNVAFAKPSWWQRLAPIFRGFDLPFLAIILGMCLLGLVNMYSVGFDHGTRFIEHGRNMLLGAVILFVVAQVPPQRLMALAVPLYTVGVVLLVATALFGLTKKGATRWLNIGIVIQPSELLKIATPLMLAWWFQRREGQLRGLDFAAATGLLLVPVGLVLKQPDLGTSLLVLSGGLYVIFFAGLSWRFILPVLIAGVVASA
jgi:rod shape determining protein RodA